MDTITQEKRADLKQYLKRYKWIKKDIEQAEEEVIQINARLYNTKSQVITDMPRGGKGIDMVDRIGMKEEVEKRLESYKIKAEEIRTELENIFDQIPDYKLRLVLRTVYIYGYSLSDAAYTLDYNYRYMLTLHQQAIDEIINLKLCTCYV